MNHDTVDPRDEAQHAAELLELGDAFFELDRAWRIVRVNRNQERLSQKPRAETVGRVFWDVWPETAAPGTHYWREYHRCMEERVPVQFEDYYAPLDLWTGVTAYPTTAGIAVFFRDLTAQKRADEASARDRELLTRLFERLPVMITTYDPNLGTFRFNDEFKRILGWTEQDAAAGGLMTLAYPDPAVRAEAAAHMTSLAPGWREFDVTAKGGAVVPSAWANLRLADSTQVGIGIDLRERRRSHEALRASEERLRAIFEDAAVGIVEVDEGDRFVAVNRRFCAMLGYSREELLGKRPHDITAPEDLPATIELNAKGHTGELRKFEYEKRYLRRDGSRLWVHVTVSVVRDDAGRFVRAVGTAEDVTERRRSQDALRASEERWNAAIENFSEGAIIATEDEQVIYWNPAARAMHGLATDRDGVGPLEETPKTFELWTPDGARLLALDEWPMRRIKRGETVRRMELRLRRPDQGWERIVSYSGAMVETAGGERLVFLSVTDLTEQRRAELALREADRRKDDFLGMLSHELRNPLAPIRNALYILDHAQPHGQQAHRARNIMTRQVNHLTRLVDDLLDVTRIARGKVELRHEDLDLAALVRRTAEDYRPLMQDRGLDLAVEVPPAPALVNGDPARLTQVLGNLLNNAAKFTPAGGRVTLVMGADGGRAAVRVRDTGPGIAPDVLPTVFEPFVQGKQTLARSEGGLGLGLSLVKGLVALHGGEVAVVSDGPGHGTEFVVTLPLARAARDEAPAAAEGASGKRGARGRRRVLVVDDNRDAADTIAQLVEMLGHTPVVAYDAVEGLTKASEHPPDVVLCDIGLPGVDGYEFARRFRAASARRGSVRLIALSGYAQPEDVTRAREAGFDAHVAKPPAPEKLGEILSA